MEEIDKEKFGYFLSELRKEKGFTQKELADRLFISNKAVSKRERGQSLPDISLLTPLAQVLEVTVAELLKGERIEKSTMDTSEAKALVNKAVQLSEQEKEKREKSRRAWRWAWVICAAVSALETMLLIQFGQLTAVELWDFLLLVEGMSLGFGGYFCFWAKETLPAYYDENKICAYSDGIFRMNLPGVCVNNSNWPHILNAGRWWLLGTAVIYPPVYGLMRGSLPSMGQLVLTLAFCLGFFVPMIYSAKKYQ